MSWPANTWVLNLRTAPNGERLTPPERHLLLLLSVRHNHDFGGAYPDRKRLAEESGWSLRKIAGALNDLERKGVLHIAYGRLPNRKRGNIYRFIGLDPIPASDPKRRRLGGRKPNAPSIVDARRASEHHARRASGEMHTSAKPDAPHDTADASHDTFPPGGRVREESQEESTTTARAGADDVVVALLVDVGVTRLVAVDLAKQHDADLIRQQLAWLPYRDAVSNPAGVLVRAIHEDWAAPPRWLKVQERAAKRQEEQRSWDVPIPPDGLKPVSREAFAEHRRQRGAQRLGELLARLSPQGP